ncbi:hypothetical protein MGSAQ_001294 [marine sediment metagenome]|uniref:Uncharacterized protein n=1 Tax=marine sediment metagenome TaxID=412755 RepID=A0A1B6NUT4_9ZZZZ
MAEVIRLSFFPLGNYLDPLCFSFKTCCFFKCLIIFIIGVINIYWRPAIKMNETAKPINTR